MRPIALLTIVVGLFASIWTVGPARAAGFLSFVSGAGNDGNTCTRTSPCVTLQAALANTFTNGEIDCLDGPGDSGLGLTTITKSITIDCTGFPTVLENGGNGITISLPGSDPFQTVHLR